MFDIEVISLFIYAVLAGNAATTAFFRIPRNIPINGWKIVGGKKPHCSNCGHLLRFWEYLPVLSWIFTKWRCSYCGSKTDIAYPILEIGSVVIIFVLYMFLGFGERIVINFLFFAALLLNTMLFVRHKRIFLKSMAIMLSSIIVNLVYEVDCDRWICLFK